MRSARTLDALAAGLLALAACAHGRGDGQATLPESRVALRLVDVEGATLNVAALRGRVVLLTMMTTWVQPALVEVPLLTELYRDYGGELEVVAVVLDAEPRMLAIFKETFDVPSRVTRPVDPAALTGSEGPFGPIGVLPTSVILDRDGRIAARMDGVWPPEVLRRAVQRLVASNVAPDPGTQ